MKTLIMVAVKPITDRYNLVLQGNIPLTTRMLLGTQQDNMKYVIDLLDALPNHNNLILSPGCDMPYATPVENVIATVEAIRDPKNTRQILAHYQAAQMDLDSIHLPDYAHLETPLMEVFTLDSAPARACGYMLNAAPARSEELGDQVQMVEYKATSPENIARMTKLGIKKPFLHSDQRRTAVFFSDPFTTRAGRCNQAGLNPSGPFSQGL